MAAPPKLDVTIAQLELLLDELEARGETEAGTPATSIVAERENRCAARCRIICRAKSWCTVRRRLELPLPALQWAVRRLGEDVTEILEIVPVRFMVIRHARPKFSRRSCEAISTADRMGERPREVEHLAVIDIATALHDDVGIRLEQVNNREHR